MGWRQLVKGIGGTILKLPEKSILTKRALNFSTVIQVLSWDFLRCNNNELLDETTHLYWASVILGLKGNPFMERPVRILKERKSV